MQGKAYGQTQIGQKASYGEARQHHSVVWNCPIDISFKSPNPFGWPQLVFCLYSVDPSSADASNTPCLAYGVTHVPLNAGQHDTVVRLFALEPSSPFQALQGWFLQKPPQLKDPAMLSRGEGRELTRTASQGTISVKFNVVVKDMASMGYVAN